MQKDVMEGFDQETIELVDDYDGKAVAVLVSKKITKNTGKAVLYIHGFADYFFNPELAEKFNSFGYDFYALDLRRYGRSTLPHHHPNLCKDVSEYFEEIDKAVSLIRERDNHSHLILNGHSTGGLTTSLYAHERRDAGTIDGLLLNSPWYEINEDWFTRNVLAKLLYFIGKLSPATKAPKGLDPNYPRSVHKDYGVEEKKAAGVYEQGHWDFNLEWKSIVGFPVYTGFLRAVRNGQKRLHKGLSIKCPVHMLCSDKRGAQTKELLPHYFNSDCVLNPAHMHKYIGGIAPNPKVTVINDGMHDLALSPKPVRERFYEEVEKWLSSTFS